MRLPVAPYPDLHVAAFVTRFPEPLGRVGTVPALAERLRLDADVPFAPDEAVRLAVRDLLRHRGYKPTGRGKPASEYLVKAAEAGTLGSINAAVDACNVTSLHSGFPISVVDLGRTQGDLRIDVAPEGASYAFNPTGQEIHLDGLLCLFDADGPCANAVRDSQRTKTHDGTTRTLSVVWGLDAFRGRLDAATDWYHSLLHDLGAETEAIEVDQ